MALWRACLAIVVFCMIACLFRLCSFPFLLFLQRIVAAEVVLLATDAISAATIFRQLPKFSVMTT